jgi:subtilisin family serine protease
MFKKYFFSGLLIVVLIATMISPAIADDGTVEPLYPIYSTDTGEMVNETPQLWFVEFNGSPTADGGRLTTVRAEKQTFRTRAERAGLEFQERFAYDKLWNGISIEISQSELPKLFRIPGVKAVYPVETYALPEPVENPSPELISALAMTGADIVQSELGFTGKGIKVAVMDTGVDFDHPDLGGCFGPGCRVFTGYDFVGDAFNADPSSLSYNPVPQPDPIPDDCNGHGTHVAGIIGANGTLKGVAPDVMFGAYRVFGCQGSTTADIMLMAMERALDDGMQVLNMSIGSAFQWPQYPTAQAADRLVKQGMVVVASIGNSGANGLYSAGAPGLGNQVIGVASFDNTDIFLKLFLISPDDRPIGYGVASSAPEPPTSGTFPMARTGTVTSTADACTALPANSLAGKIALIRRGTCTFHQKALNAMNAGAIGVVLYNNTAGRFSATVAGTPAITIPVVTISDTEGALIDSRLAGGDVFLTWTDQEDSFPNPTGGLISSFSSYGLSPDLNVKPDIGAPGGLIYSTFPLEQGGYATLSGTSMSSPHVAGAAALLLQAKPNLPAGVVRTIFQNTADPAAWWGNPALGFLDNVHRQGAGMLDIPQAILSTVRVEPSKLALGESETGPATRTLTIANEGNSTVTIRLSHQPALATGANTFSPSFAAAFASVSFSSSEVKVAPKSKVRVNVTITAPSVPLRGQYGGYLVMTSDDGKVYRVPYAGFIGDYQSIQVLAPTAYGFPWLSVLIGGSYYHLTDLQYWFSMVGDDIPYFLVHFDHQSRRFKMEVYQDMEKGPDRYWYNAYDESYLPRNSSSAGFFAFPFDGFTYAGSSVFEVPDGIYYVKISVLKALGDPNNPAHWETWTSPLFEIDRP